MENQDMLLNMPEPESGKTEKEKKRSEEHTSELQSQR